MRLAEQEQAAVNCFMEELQQIAGRIGIKEEKKKPQVSKEDTKPNVTIKTIKKDNKKSKIWTELPMEEPMEEVKASSISTKDQEVQSPTEI